MIPGLGAELVPRLAADFGMLARGPDEIVKRVDEVVHFDGGASYDPDGTVVLWKWNFGNGVTRDTSTPTIDYIYRATGIYKASLAVVDNDGQESERLIRPITILPKAPALERPIAVFAIR